MAVSQFLLGLDYVQPSGQAGFLSTVLAVSTDAQGNAYVASGTEIFKYTAGGQILWHVSVGSGTGPTAMAADAAGNVYLLVGTSLQRINSDGNGATSLLDFGSGVSPRSVAIDAANRIWVAGNTNAGVSDPIATTPGAFQQTLSNTTFNHIFIARLNQTGTAIEYATYLAGSSEDDPAGIAVDNTGALIISGMTRSADFPLTAGSGLSSWQSGFLARFKPAGTGVIYSMLLPQYLSSPAATAQGEAVLAVPGPFNQALVLAYAPDGTLLFQRAVPGAGRVAVDAADNIYVVGALYGGNAPTKNSIASCGGSFLSVLGPSGDTLQATWLPTSAGLNPLDLAVAGSTVYFAASQYGSSGTQMTALTRLSQHADVVTFALGCLTDAAVYQIPGGYQPTAATITPGEIVSLFGERLAPAEATQPSITGDAGFPKELSSVQVLFDGQPAPLLYVQDSQINAVAPWSLTPGKNTQVCVSYSGTQTNCLAVPVVTSAPAVFTIDGTNAAAVNQDGTINSALHPAPVGSIVAIFATGLGATTPALADGGITHFPLPQNQLPVTAKVVVSVSPIGGADYAPCDVTYYGPAPLEVAGLSQINLRLPTSLPDTLGVATGYLQVGDAVGWFNIYTGKP
jgi:uncharacterized protein (TIGR03437 family)